MRRPFCLRRFEKLCLCTASLVERTRLAMHKQSFFNLLGQNGHRVTKVYILKHLPLEPLSYRYLSVVDNSVAGPINTKHFTSLTSVTYTKIKGEGTGVPAGPN